jgi:biotin transporter BioY
MDGWGIAICVMGYVAYHISKRQKKPQIIFIFISGIGLGLLIGAIWAYYLVTGAFRGL